MGSGASRREQERSISKNSQRTAASSNSDREGEPDSPNLDALDDSEEEQLKRNEVRSNTTPDPSRGVTSTTNANRKRSSLISDQSRTSHNSPSSVQNNPTAMQTKTAHGGQMNASSNSMKRQDYSNQQNSDTDDDSRKSRGNTNGLRRIPNETARSELSVHSGKRSTSSKKNNKNVDRPTSTIPIQKISQPYLCPHCHQNMPNNINKLEDQQPLWIIHGAHTDDAHINMDEYDEESMQEKINSKHGRLPGHYYYSDDDAPSNDYPKQISLSKYGSVISPTHTPYPNYDLLQRHAYRLNKPFTATLYSG